jgi:hypothetical protein
MVGDDNFGVIGFGTLLDSGSNWIRRFFRLWTEIYLGQGFSLMLDLG